MVKTTKSLTTKFNAHSEYIGVDKFIPENN